MSFSMILKYNIAGGKGREEKPARSPRPPAKGLPDLGVRIFMHKHAIMRYGTG